MPTTFTTDARNPLRHLKPVTLANVPVPVAPEGHALCPVCGTAFPVRAGQAGRPRETCSAVCRDVAKVETLLDGIMDQATPRHWLALRRKLWRSLNARAWNRGVKHGG